MVEGYTHPNNNPLIPAEKVRSQTNRPGCRRFFSRRRETSERPTSIAGPSSVSGSCRISGSSAESAILWRAIELEAVVKEGVGAY